jgi:hypothetical protein
MLKLKFAALAGAALVVAQPVSAATLVDTGQPTFVGGGSIVATYQWLAAEFTLGSSATVNQVQGWLGVSDFVPLRITIRSDAGNAPGSEIYSADFLGLPSEGAWQGAKGLSWALAAGDYWVSFESDHSDQIAYMPGGAPGLLNRYAFTSNQASSWNEGGFAGVGVRIFGTTGAVPEPATWALMISGFGLVGTAARRRTRSAAVYA